MQSILDRAAEVHKAPETPAPATRAIARSRPARRRHQSRPPDTMSFAAAAALYEACCDVVTCREILATEFMGSEAAEVLARVDAALEFARGGQS